jgi:integrase
LKDDEVRALWSASAAMGYPFGPIYRLLLLTGQRKSEVSDAQWCEFDLNANLWTIPAVRMKADAAHLVPLTTDVVAILLLLPRFKNGDRLLLDDVWREFGVGIFEGKAPARPCNAR